ncbi:MAG TPA: zinc ribbon domain-containing protein [bacterium]|nr:zinc ribbon domain-containing protein [bacterium]
MPIFEFRCQACGESFEELVGVVAGNGETVCPHCGSADVRKKISVPAPAGSGRSSSMGSGCAPGG